MRVMRHLFGSRCALVVNTVVHLDYGRQVYLKPFWGMLCSQMTQNTAFSNLLSQMAKNYENDHEEHVVPAEVYNIGLS